MTQETQRLSDAREHQIPWQKWGPYLSERQWGTVREDYNNHGNSWIEFPYEQAISRTYRWGEDGIAGISDDQQQLCFAIALWNGQDVFDVDGANIPLFKERLFGLTNPQGNHGEDVKEYYFYLDNTPTHSWMQYLYKYPQEAYPYNDLVAENRRRLQSSNRGGSEYELLDTGIFERDRYFDVFVEYAKADAEDLLIQIRVINRSANTSPLHLLPTLWYRNTWSWDPSQPQPNPDSFILRASKETNSFGVIEAKHPSLDNYYLYCEAVEGDTTPQLLFTNNETNAQRLYGKENVSPYVKDGISDYVIHQQEEAVNPNQEGTKASPYYPLQIAPNEEVTMRLRLCKTPNLSAPFGSDFTETIQRRKEEADLFYQHITPSLDKPEIKEIQRQAFAGLLWTKQYYLYSVDTWLKGDPAGPQPVPGHEKVRNYQWFHLDSQDILSMPDKWEYPWFAAWDLAFHTLPLALIDPEFAKNQLDIMTREWYMHPNGQIPAYEWNFSDVNPPVHAWATWQVFKIEQRCHQRSDYDFLERVFQKLLLNFTWWVNRKDSTGSNIFEGGFLGLDNIGIFNRSEALPTGGYLEQSDGTSWMAMYCLNMLTIALELATQRSPVYEDIATKFFEHFIYIADAMNHIGSGKTQLWDPQDQFFYDVLNWPDGRQDYLKVRSMVGLIPLYAVLPLDPEFLEKLPAFKERLEWFVANRPDLASNIASMVTTGNQERRLLAIANPEKLRHILTRLLDETEFLSDYGIRALSRYHAENPYVFYVNKDDAQEEYRVEYLPGESNTGDFGGNSNWRGPIWFPVNYLIINSLEDFHCYYGDSFQVECPTGSGQWLNLKQVTEELSQRLIRIFITDDNGHRPVFGHIQKFQVDPHWRNYLLFHEYFHGDNGSGVGASHQTGWTGLVAYLIHSMSHYSDQ